jgi:hypothetical protein
MSDQPYEPEMGQMCFGQPSQRYAGSELLSAALQAINDRLDMVMWNKNQEEYPSPFINSGNVEGFKNGTFEAHAYSWDEDVEQPFNFKWRDIEVSWYKHARRGLSVNRLVLPDEIAVMLQECLDSLGE